MCLVPRLWSSGNSHGHMALLPLSTTPPTASSRGSCLSSRSRGKLTLLTSGSSKAIFLHSVQTQLFAGSYLPRQSPHYQLPLTDHLSKTPGSGTIISTNLKYLDDLNICTQHPASNSLDLIINSDLYLNSTFLHHLIIPTRPCLHFVLHL